VPQSYSKPKVGRFFETRSIGRLHYELCKNGWIDLNDQYVYDVFPRNDVTFGNVVDNAAYLLGKIPKNSILGAWTRVVSIEHP